MIGAWEQLAPSLGDNGFNLVAEIDQRERALASVLAPYDAVAMLGQLVQTEMARVDDYVESEHEGMAARLEIVAGVLSARAGRRGTREPSLPIGKDPLDRLRRLTTEIILLEGLRRFRSSGGFDGGPLGGARARAAVANLMLRNPGWVAQEESLLCSLFAPFSDQLRAAIGFDADEAVACSSAATMAIQDQKYDHMVFDADRRAQVFEWANAVMTGWQDRDEPIRDVALDIMWALTHAGDATLLRHDELAERAGVASSVARAYLTALSTTFGQTGTTFERAERIRYSPYLMVRPDAFFLTVPGNDLWTLRPFFESVLKSERYSRWRGAWLEQQSMEMLSAALRPDESHRGIEIFDGPRKIGEIDGLLRFGDVAVVVEAKSATMRPGARRGGIALIRHLKGTLSKAATQGTTALQVLHGELVGDLRQKNGSPVRLGAEVREVHPVLVTLDDLSAVGPVAWELAGSEVLPEGVTIPWIVTRHELDLVCRMIESPIQFTHFLRRRSRLNQIGGRIASDELDWWMLYLDNRLYFEEDQSDGRVRYLSQTDALDAWYLFEEGERERPAEKPTQRLDEGTRAFLTALDDERPGGWVAAGCLALDASGESATRMWRELRRAQRRASRRGRVQRGTHGYDRGIEPMLICRVVVPDIGRAQLLPQLEHYADERLGEYGVRRVLGIGLTASSERAYDALLVFERAKWTLPSEAPPPAENPS